MLSTKLVAFFVAFVALIGIVSATPIAGHGPDAALSIDKRGCGNSVCIVGVLNTANSALAPVIAGCRECL